ncbi:MAG: hypothetical protein SFU91_12705 [Chloroherpetonaceae bacterium]|nr:hypothetical protein [Chloroherpetonaceae bacterium]
MTYKLFYLIFLINGCASPASNEITSEVSGITRTDAQGRVLQQDPDDWRIQRNFNGFISLDPLYPNPTSNGIVSIGIRYSLPSPIRLDILSTSTANTPVLVGSFNTPSFGTQFYTFNLQSLSATGNLAELKGKIFRLRFYDGSGALITYGDVQFE